jgi:hypothetical protein
MADKKDLEQSHKDLFAALAELANTVTTHAGDLLESALSDAADAIHRVSESIKEETKKK